MDIKILEYNNDVTVKTIDNFDDVEMMIISVVSGDEVLKIAYNDGTVETVDPGGTNRYEDYVDYIYVIYDAKKSENVIDYPGFMDRTSAYWLEDENTMFYDEFCILM